MAVETEKRVKTKQIFYWIIGFVFALGICLRTLSLFYNNCFEDDECRLILAFLDKPWHRMFMSIGDAQSEPPIFIVSGRILGTISGYEERFVKLIPYLCSILSLFVFYKLTDRILVENYSKILANFLFAINTKLILFSSIFKQYSSDVLTGIVCMLFLPVIQLQKLTKKQLILLGSVILVLPFISLPSLFFIGAFFFVNIKNLKKLLPIVFFLLFYIMC